MVESPGLEAVLSGTEASETAGDGASVLDAGWEGALFSDVSPVCGLGGTIRVSPKASGQKEEN